MTQIDESKGFQINDVIKIQSTFYKITGRDNLRLPITPTSSGVASGATSSDISLDDLNPKYEQEIYQIVQIVPKHNVQIFLKQPASTLRWGTNKKPSVAYLFDRMSTFDGGENNNIFITNYQQPVIQMKNGTNITLIPTIYFIGWKYSVVKVPQSRVTVFTEEQVKGLD